MKTMHSRRTFLASAAAAGIVAAVPSGTFAFPAAASRMRFGYTAMTWGDADRQAIDDISAVGYPGIQFRVEAVTEFTPQELRSLLRQHKLTFVALSSGVVSIDSGDDAAQIDIHVNNAKFVRDTGGLYLQVLDALKPYPRTVTPDECTRLGKLLTEIGKRTAELGIPLGYHNHLNTISEHPDNLRRVLAASDPKYVKLELDTAHALAGGGDPASMIETYRDRLLFLHLKDVIDIPLGSEHSKYPFKFVELGRGKVNFPGIFAAIRKIDYQGWAVIELDRVPDNSTTPKESAIISKDYLEHTIGVKV